MSRWVDVFFCTTSEEFWRIRSALFWAGKGKDRERSFVIYHHVIKISGIYVDVCTENVHSIDNSLHPKAPEAGVIPWYDQYTSAC
jgi:hypothetical protein